MNLYESYALAAIISICAGLYFIVGVPIVFYLVGAILGGFDAWYKWPLAALVLVFFAPVTVILIVTFIPYAFVSWLID